MKQSSRVKLANVLLSAVNLREGQCLHVRTEPVHWPFVAVLAEEAYRLGAKYVHVEANHPLLHKARIDHSREDYLPFVYGFRSAMNDELVDDKWARIVLHGEEMPELAAALDPVRNGKAKAALSKADLRLRAAVQADRIRWLVAPLPTPAWAGKVLGIEPNEAATEKLWEILEPILRLDQPDPVGAWKVHGEALGRRQDALRSLDLDSVRFSGPGTDLTVGLPAGAQWIGGGSTCPEGYWFLPNLPTEEVFTTPDFRRTSGHITLTRPALVMGAPVSGAKFTFKEGRVVEWSAESGQGALDALFEVDDQARYLGEVALVDTDSPVFKSGLVFNNTLLDENAASHIAFGSAYPGGIPGGNDLSPEQLLAAGGNVSNVHTDVMIGSPEVDVTGTSRDGREVRIMRGGRWEV